MNKACYMLQVAVDQTRNPSFSLAKHDLHWSLEINGPTYKAPRDQTTHFSLLPKSHHSHLLPRHDSREPRNRGTRFYLVFFSPFSFLLLVPPARAARIFARVSSWVRDVAGPYHRSQIRCSKTERDPLQNVWKKANEEIFETNADRRSCTLDLHSRVPVVPVCSDRSRGAARVPQAEAEAV